MIKVKEENEGKFLVIIGEKNTETEYNVEVDDEYYQKLTEGRITKQELIKKSFQFLLERESKESIFSSFNLRIIKSYFPEYEQVIK